MENKVAIVTGGTAGIGGEIATTLAKSGVTVVVTSRTLERAQDKVAEIMKHGGNGLAVPCNLESSAEMRSLVGTVIDTYGQLDILVNNAVSHQTLPPLSIQDLAFEELAAGINTNLTNVLGLTCEAYPYLKTHRGSVLNIGSAVINQHLRGIPLYTIVKGSLSQMTKVLAYEWAPDVRVNQINPGFTRTAAHKEIGIPDDQVDTFLEAFRKFHPLERVGKPQDISLAAEYLVSDKAAWITGIEMNIDGGYSVNGRSL